MYICVYMDVYMKICIMIYVCDVFYDTCACIYKYIHVCMYFITGTRTYMCVIKCVCMDTTKAEYNSGSTPRKCL